MGTTASVVVLTGAAGQDGGARTAAVPRALQ